MGWGEWGARCGLANQRDPWHGAAGGLIAWDELPSLLQRLTDDPLVVSSSSSSSSAASPSAASPAPAPLEAQPQRGELGAGDGVVDLDQTTTLAVDDDRGASSSPPAKVGAMMWPYRARA